MLLGAPSQEIEWHDNNDRLRPPGRLAVDRRAAIGPAELQGPCAGVVLAVIGMQPISAVVARFGERTHPQVSRAPGAHSLDCLPILGHGPSAQLQVASASTTKSMHLVKASTSAGSTAG